MFLYSRDESKVAQGYRKYWVDNIDKALGYIFGEIHSQGGALKAK